MKTEQSVRKPAVAGMFYPANPNALREQIADLRESERSSIKTELATTGIIGGVVPHAGYIYSGYEAVHFFELIRLSEKEFETIVILNPDHQGYSPAYATSPHDEWETPLGSLSIDKEMAELFPQSEITHRDEHSAEVMLPFIQVIFKNQPKILPIAIGKPTPEASKKLAQNIFDAAKSTGRKILIIASSDFSHYVTPEEGVKLDDLVLDKIEKLDSNGISQVIKQFGITVCGFGPIMTLLEYSLLISESPKVDIAARGNSGKHSPSKSVVDYITIIVSA
jgi:MEMO1 family protein